MVTGLALTLFDFQENAVMKLLDLAADRHSKQTIVVKSPTGSGKTIILIGCVDEYLDTVLYWKPHARISRRASGSWENVDHKKARCPGPLCRPQATRTVPQSPLWGSAFLPPPASPFGHTATGDRHK